MDRRVGVVEVPVAKVVEEPHLSEPRRSSPGGVFAAAAGDENDGCDPGHDQAGHSLILPNGGGLASLKPRWKTSITGCE